MKGLGKVGWMKVAQEATDRQRNLLWHFDMGQNYDTAQINLKHSGYSESGWLCEVCERLSKKLGEDKS